MFIKTRREAKIAVETAEDYGWEMEESDFHRRYLTNVFGPWRSTDDARLAERAILDAIRAERAWQRRMR